ncbi:MAG: sterol desaturase family protein, partial [Myxococcales bacterium]|nr:sterol desaturase family protein [Myxococcales bacterium]
VGFILIDELLHGWAHNFAHGPTPKNPVLAAIKRFYLEAHRPHHMNGGPDGRGELSVTQVTVAGWGWYFFLPNYWFGVACLYFGLAEVWLWGFTIKNLWGVHVHANWTYDLYLLNHGSPWVRKATRALCHVLTLPNQHHHHHGRGANSGKNMQNMLALYDWLLWKTLVIETERPAVYGWRQTEREARSPFHRYVRRTLPFSRLGNGLRAR